MRRGWAISRRCSSTRPPRSTCSSSLLSSSAQRPRPPPRAPSWRWTMQPVPVRGSTQQAKAAYRTRVEELREELEQARDWRMTSAPRGPRRSWTSSRASWPEPSVSAAATGPRHRRPSARARAWDGRSTRPCARSLRRCRSSARISSAPSAPACLLLPSRAGAGLRGAGPAHRAPESALPRGTVTFMLTDVEGSTRLFAQHRREAARALRRHEELIAAAVPASRGTLLQERGEGDSTFALFARATDALACALEVQRAMEREDWPGGLHVRVRVGLLAGEADPGESDWRGIGVNRCARIRALAHGGQVLVSGSVRELAGEDLPRGSEPARPRAAPAAGPRAPGASLPARPPRPAARLPAAPLCGSASPQPAAPAHQLRRARAGARRARDAARPHPSRHPDRGGRVGKDPAGEEVAATQVERTRDGAWFVDLAPVFDPQLVLKAVAQVLGVRERPHSDLLDDILERVRESELLLVLDNCEHLVEACARLAEDLLRACPDLRLLATSREPLGVPGERVFRTGSLAVPATGDSPDAIARAESVVLFGDRASAALGSFELAPETAPVVAHVCRRLDGLPLAIELAAARTASLSLDDLGIASGRLLRAAHGRRPDGAAASADPRGDGRVELRAAQRAPTPVVRPAVGVRRGWTLAAAETVCASAGRREALRRRRSGRAGRQVARRAQGADPLPAARDAPAVRERPAARGGTGRRRSRCPPGWAVGLAEEAERNLDGFEQAAWLDRLERELDNLRAALEWAITLGQRRGGPPPCLDHGRQPVDVALARARGPAVAAAPAGRPRQRWPRPCGPRAFWPPVGSTSRPASGHAGRPVRAEPRALPRGRRRRGGGSRPHLDGVQSLGDRGRRRDRRHPRGRHRCGAARGAAAGDGDSARTERNLVVAPRPRSGAARSWRRAGS